MDKELDTPLLPPHIPPWATGGIYQIIVPSFADDDGDGMGDLRGVIGKLDYLKWLGVSGFWLSPIYPSPMIDLGYDVVDYTDVNPRFGTLEVFDQLVTEAHRRDLHVVLDFVPNHTSDQHAWFRASRFSRDNPWREWYLWRDARPGGGPPNNWTNQYEQSDWTWDEATGQYYFHSFTPEQPDLNWQNPEVRVAMEEALRFWLDRGVDGIRIDAMVHFYKDPRLRDNPPVIGSSRDTWPAWNMLPAYSQDCGGLQEIVRELCQAVREYPGRIVIGENHLAPERLALYYRSGVTLPANSLLLDLKWDSQNIQRMIDRYEGFLTDDDWPNWILGSHDNQRVAGYLGQQRARLVAMLQLTLRGTPIMYYGEELGMHNVDVRPEREVDALAIRMPGRGRGRDGQRTPMQWSSGANAGFTSGEPWLPVADDYEAVNVEVQRDDSRSMLTLYRRLLALRAWGHAISIGNYTPAFIGERTLSYLRSAGREVVFVALNFADEPLELRPPLGSGRIMLSTHLDRDEEPVGRELMLRAYEGVVIAAGDQL